MKLFHVSEESDIKVFKPRKPYRNDMQHSPALVWAVDEKRLPNFLTPRDCPRVTYHIPENFEGDIGEGLFSSSTVTHVVAIESEWFNIMKNTVLYLYEFDSESFYLQDETAGYYVSEKEQYPLQVVEISDSFKELFDRNVEVRILDNLIDLRDRIIKTPLNWSMCRMGNAEKKS